MVATNQRPSGTLRAETPGQRARYVFDFSDGATPGIELVGGKGAGLAEMTALGLPVPPGFTVTTEACREFLEAGGTPPAGLMDEVREHMRRLEVRAGRRFGDADDPLLVSVRSGAAVSMPGMLETVLNVGLNDTNVEGLAARTGDRRFAVRCYIRLIEMYGSAVHGLGRESTADAAAGQSLDERLAEAKRAFIDTTGLAFPQDPQEQLEQAVGAVFRSWMSPRAEVYRKAHGISITGGTAVSVVQMVFGNRDEQSGTGVAFTRNPSTGARGVWGEFLGMAQGEEIVSGARTPLPLAQMKWAMPDVYARLAAALGKIEARYRDMQDVEFTVESGRLYVLQTRAAKRTVAAALRSAVEMAAEGLISKAEAVCRTDPKQLDQLLHASVGDEAGCELAATGLAASPGAATGKIALDADSAAERGRDGEAVVLVRQVTSPDDIHGVIQARGVLTARGGMTSHAAVVARGMGKPCVAGCDRVVIDMARRTVRIGDRVLDENDEVTIDGATGRVFYGSVPLIPARPDEHLPVILRWADELRTMGVLANADTPDDARKARELGAEGVGLCRTEHMFMAPNRLAVMQEMILAETDAARRDALDRLLPVQQADFEGIFEAMDLLPVTVRLLDPPLHEFLPAVDATTDGHLRARAESLREVNPMLGLRGCRLGLMYPEIYEMQVRAIVRAARAVQERTGHWPVVEVMHPLVGMAEEMRRLRELTVRVAEEEGAGEIAVGSMIELPRACVRAGEIAEHAEFFSFGTNDLTQTVLGFSRDDVEASFMPTYLQKGVLAKNPFESLDVEGVGALMAIAVERARAVRPQVRMGVCGEHGGDAASISFFESIGIDYVSCSPYRVPAARIAAAQAAVRHEATARRIEWTGGLWA